MGQREVEYEQLAQYEVPVTEWNTDTFSPNGILLTLGGQVSDFIEVKWESTLREVKSTDRFRITVERVVEPKDGSE